MMIYQDNLRLLSLDLAVTNRVIPDYLLEQHSKGVKLNIDHGIKDVIIFLES